jgi:hypothetical protein
MIIGLIIIFQICVALYWIGGIYFTMHKGMDEIIKGLNSMDQRLCNLERCSEGTQQQGNPSAS